MKISNVNFNWCRNNIWQDKNPGTTIIPTITLWKEGCEHYQLPEIRPVIWDKYEFQTWIEIRIVFWRGYRGIRLTIEGIKYKIHKWDAMDDYYLNKSKCQ